MFAYRDEENRWTEIVGDFVVGDVQYPAAWPALVDHDDREAAGVAEIVEDPEPIGVRLVGSDIVDRDGVPARVWRTEPFGPDELRAAVDVRAGAAFLEGFAPPHPAFAGERLQVRNNEDRTNWLTSQAAYSAAVAGGMGAIEEASFRTAANRTITVSFADGLQVLLAMAAWGRSILARSWALKDAIATGEPYDIETGWPE